jgi:hypothetical protein
MHQSQEHAKLVGQEGKPESYYFPPQHNTVTNLNCPKLIRFVEMTDDEVFCTERAARSGVVFENTSEVEDLVVLRYFGPEASPDAPEMGAHRR